MAWKYIMIESVMPNGLIVKFPVIFPDKLVHSEVFGVLRVVVPGKHVGASSAGKIEHVDVVGLGGDSETLGLRSNREEDTVTIERYSYLHGIVEVIK